MAAVQFGVGELHLVADQLLATREPTNPLPDFYAGMTFAHEGYRVYNGYGGSEVPPSLDSLMSLNVNALAVVPYTYMPAPDRVGDLPVPYGCRLRERRGGELLHPAGARARSGRPT